MHEVNGKAIKLLHFQRRYADFPDNDSRQTRPFSIVEKDALKNCSLLYYLKNCAYPKSFLSSS